MGLILVDSSLILISSSSQNSLKRQHGSEKSYKHSSSPALPISVFCLFCENKNKTPPPGCATVVRFSVLWSRTQFWFMSRSEAQPHLDPLPEPEQIRGRIWWKPQTQERVTKSNKLRKERQCRKQKKNSQVIVYILREIKENMHL